MNERLPVACDPSQPSGHTTPLQVRLGQPSGARSRILCVDDEPAVLGVLERILSDRYDVTTCDSGSEALAVLERDGPFQVLLSDQRMPEMDGSALLGAARSLAPDTVRVLLTGHNDFEDAIRAINEGQIFRFLTKPLRLDPIQRAIEAAVEQYRLVTAERVVLVQTLTDILGMARPEAFGRARRLRRIVRILGEILDYPAEWELEVAAMLSQVGAVTVPAEILRRHQRGAALSPDEQDRIARMPEAANQLLSRVPSLSTVREIVRYQAKRYDGGGLPVDGCREDEIPLGARILKLALDFDVLRATGDAPEVALDVLRKRRGWYDPKVLEALASFVAAIPPAREIEVAFAGLADGMVLADDLKSVRGTLLVARGAVINQDTLDRVRAYAPDVGGVDEPIRVLVRAAETSPV